MRSRLFLVVVVVVIIAVGALVWIRGNHESPIDTTENVRGSSAAASTATTPPLVASPTIPPSDSAKPVAAQPPRPSLPDPSKGYGTFPAIEANTNPSTQLVADAIATHSHPERLSALVPATPWDLTAYQADPQAYLTNTEPGRVFQVAQPAAGVPHLARIGAGTYRVAQGETAELVVQGVKGMPVNFYIFDGGVFQNSLPAITLAGDADGKVRAIYKATPGVINTVNILCASPVCSGQLRYSIIVDLPAN